MHQYGATALPTYVLIGKDGKVVRQYVGDDENTPMVERMGEDIKAASQESHRSIVRSISSD